MKKVLFILLVLFSKTAAAQDVDLIDNKYQHSDQCWLKVKASLPVTGKFEVSGQYIARFFLNNNFHQGNYLYLGGKYKIKKWLQADLGTRFVVDQGYNLYRLEGGIKLKHDLGKHFQVNFRTAAFRENKTYLYTREQAKAATNYWRNRIEVSWNPVKNWTVSTSFETWNLNNNKYQLKLDKACYIAEVSYQLSKRHQILFAFQNQFDIQQKNKVSLNMYVLGYAYTFKRLNK